MRSSILRPFGGALAVVGMLLTGSAAALAAGANTGPGLPARATVTKAQSHVIRPIDIWAVVNSDGTLARGERVVSASRIPEVVPGTYVVRTTRDVTFCSYVATIGLSSAEGEEAPGFIVVNRRFDDPKAVFVHTYDTSGNSADRAFHLKVSC
jgi:hypothetical protein